MADQRLPVVSGDDGLWGTILNQFLSLQHYNDGTNNPINGSHQMVTIQLGTTVAGTAPLKFTSGSLLTTPEAGAVEFLSDKLYVTRTTGPTRLTVAAYDDSSGAAGDIYYRDGSGNFIRLGIGGTNQVLTVIGGVPSWQTASGGSGSGNSRSVIQSVGGGVPITAANVANTDYVYHIDNNFNLPDCTVNTNSYKVRNIGSNVITVYPNGSQTVAEASSFTIQPFDSWEFITDTVSNWGDILNGS